ncbi:MAG: zinc ribbon domain-containing protein [Promethearchaeota archaeon]
MNLDEYILEFKNYKRGNYKFGNYSTKEQILNEFLKGKIFVLKGGLRVGDWILTLLMFGIALVSLFAILLPDPDLGIFIIPLIFTLPTGSLMLLKPRRLLVIGPLGVSYRKILSLGVFSWKDIINIKHFTQTYRGSNIGVVVKLLISNGRKIRFGSNNYLNKEFPKKIHREMFINLFYIYFKLGQNKTSKGPSYTSYTCKLCGFKLTTEAEFCPQCGLRIMLT